MQKGFMLRPGSRVVDMCSDVIAIAKYESDKQEAVKTYLKEKCTPKKGFKLPWKEQEYECKVKTITKK